MTEQDQIKALAELDGWECVPETDTESEYWRRSNPYNVEHNPPNYLHSYDAIIPLIQKQIGKGNIGHLFILHLWEVCGLQKLRGSLLLSSQDSAADHNLLVDKIWELFVTLTPSQLSEALLRATGKWKE